MNSMLNPCVIHDQAYLNFSFLIISELNLPKFSGKCRDGLNGSYVISSSLELSQYICWEKCQKTEGCTAFAFGVAMQPHSPVKNCWTYRNKNGPYTQGTPNAKFVGRNWDICYVIPGMFPFFEIITSINYYS